MGALLANRIPGQFRKVIISRDRAEAAQVADEVGGLAADQISAVRGCQVVFLLVSGSTMPQLVRDMSPHLAEGALVVNMATDVTTADLITEFPKLRFAAAKVLGHAREMSLGARGVVVIDHADEGAVEELHSLLDGLGPVVRGSEETVRSAGAAVAEVMEDAQTRVLTRLTQLGLERHLAQLVLAAAGPAVLRTLAEADETVPAGAMHTRNVGALASH
jgi:pyrroline-5-carboxylate reductase